MTPSASAEPAEAGPDAAGPPATGLAAKFKGRSELGIVLLLLVVAAFVFWDAAGIEVTAGQRGPVGPKVVPNLIGGLLVACAAILAIAVLRGDQGESEGGEDVDLTRGSDWRTIAMLIAVFGVNVALIEPAGWVISGSLLFWGSVYTLGSRHYVRDLVVSVALALATFYAFAIGLGIYLPAGILQGIL